MILSDIFLLRTQKTMINEKMHVFQRTCEPPDVGSVAGRMLLAL